ncbi:alkaline phosphatase [Actinoplanes sp. SE50]|uniref:DedA family protein n=1 Tax=unclassified Actinoplanes TaxID=2626549 RepID=UPI00023ED09D|nr:MULTISPECIES: DedA family protein [unclassified Actinoplanes]AEV84927.1 Alkaline phosphatase-like protein [Actinoplanes sp. SE50/110]ATO83318.1 alkaline phosphatase [Actinoplanes sp. SE50]SLM00725.1 alkaline phosphatase [Actinoplanes sp. SE50/110]
MVGSGLAAYGYLGVAVTVFVEGFGVPAPGETAIIAASGAAGHGHLNIVAVAVTAFVAAVCGDSVGYLIGRLGGRRLVLRYGRFVRLTPARFARFEKFMARHGAKVVAGARFVEGLRQLNGVVAGATGMPWPRFLVCNAIGAALWVGVWSTVGFVAGDHWTGILGALHRYQPYVIAAVVAAVAGALLWHRRAH